MNVIKKCGAFAAALFLLAAVALGAMAFVPARADSAPALHGSDLMTVSDLGGGKYSVRGNTERITRTYVWFDGIPVPDDGNIYVSLDLKSYPFADEVDTWLSFLVGTDQGEAAYGPNTVLANGVGPYYSQLMRIGRDGSINGDYFVNGVVQGSFATIRSSSLEFHLQYSGASVQLSINGTPVQSFTAQDAETCFISFVQHSAVTANVYEYEVSAAAAAQGTNMEYDLAVGGDTVAVPLKTMGTQFVRLENAGGDTLQEGEDYTLAASDTGLQNIVLDASLVGAQEGEQASFTVVGDNGGAETRTSFTVSTVDNSVAAVQDGSYDKAAPADLVLPMDAGTLTDIALTDAEGQPVAQAEVSASAITFPQAYLDGLDYGTYTYTVSGKKVSGVASESTSFTLTVYDSRLPAFASDRIEFDAAESDGDLELSFSLYDGAVSKVLLNGTIVPSTDYSYADGVLALDQLFAETVVGYGENTLTVVTDKNEAVLTIVKTDSRTPVVSATYTYDVSDEGEYFTFVSEWYAAEPDGLTLNGAAVDGWQFTLRGIRVPASALRALGTGTFDGAVTAGGQSYPFTLNVIDGSAPKVSAVHHYDAAHGLDAEIVFAMNGCTFAGVLYGGQPFGGAEFADGTVRIPAAWFAEKLGSGACSVGDTLVFTVVWESDFVPEGLREDISVRVVDSSDLTAQTSSFDKKSGEDFLLPAFLNGYDVLGVRVNGAYTTDYSVTEEGVVLGNAFVRSLPVGDLSVVVELSRYDVTLRASLADTRSAESAGGEDVFFIGDSADGFLFAMNFYENTVYSMADWQGATVAPYNYTVTEEGILFDAAWLEEMGGGYFTFSLTTRRTDGGITTQETLSFSFYIVEGSSVSVTPPGEYDLASGENLTLKIDFKDSAFAGLKADGVLLDSYHYLRTGSGALVLYASGLQSMGAGTHTLAVVSDRGETEFTLTVKDSRVNTLTAETLTLNPGAREVVLYGDLPNAAFTLSLDGAALSADAYEVHGNYIVLSEAFVGSLGAGTHTLAIATEGGEDTMTLEIMDTAASYTAPVLISAAVSLVVFGGAAAAGVVLIRRKRNHQGGEQ